MKDFILESQIQHLPNNSSFLYISIKGSLTKKNIPQFDQFLKSIAKEKTERIVLEFLTVEAIDSTGIGLLANFHEQLKEKNVELKLASVPSKISHLFKMLGMDSFLQTYSSKEEAIRSFSGGESFVEEKKVKIQKEITEEVPISMLDEQPKRMAVKTIKVKRDKSKVGEKNHSLLVQVEYFKQMVMFRNFSLKITITKKQKDKNAIFSKKHFEITPHIPGCLTVPASIKINNLDFQEVCFNITPVTTGRKIYGQIIISKRNTILQKLPLCFQVTNANIPKALLCIGGVLACLFLDIFLRNKAIGGIGLLVAIGLVCISLFLNHHFKPIKAPSLLHVWDRKGTDS